MLSLDWILRSAEVRADEAMVIRHAYVREHEDSGLQGIHADSTDDEILYYTSRQSATQRVFPVTPPRYWIVSSVKTEGVLGSGRLSKTTVRPGTTAGSALSP